MVAFLFVMLLVLTASLFILAANPRLNQPLLEFIRKPTLSRQKRKAMKDLKRHKLAAQLLKVQLEQHKIAMTERRTRHARQLKEFDAHFPPSRPMYPSHHSLAVHMDANTRTLCGGGRTYSATTTKSSLVTCQECASIYRRATNYLSY
jgi:hypothetical protein